MSIRIRKIESETVALCAAKTRPKKDDIYLDDNAHHALMTKFTVDLESEGWLKENSPVDEKVKKLMLRILSKENMCPKCKNALITPFWLNGVNGVGIIQCSKCDYSQRIKPLKLTLTA